MRATSDDWCKPTPALLDENNPAEPLWVRWLPLAHLRRSEFARNAMTLVTGSALAQGIAVASAFVFARIYSVGDFGVYALYCAIVGPLAVAATGQYETGILLSREDDDAYEVLVLTSIVAMLFSAVVLLALNVLTALVGGVPQLWGMGSWLYCVPAAILLLGVNRAQNGWLLRHKRFRMLAAIRVLQVAVLAAAAIVLGLAWSGPAGLVLGFVAGQAAAVLLSAAASWRLRPSGGRPVSIASLKSHARRYRNFPLFSAPGQLVNQLGTQTPVFLMSIFFGPVPVGSFSLTQRVLSAPLALVGKSIDDVFTQRASKEMIDRGSFGPLFRRAAKVLAILAIPAFLVPFVGGPRLFAWLFGEQWTQAGEFARILSVFFFVQFVVSPVTATFYITEKQRVDFFWQVALLAVNALAVTVGGLTGSPTWCIALYTLSYSVMYVVRFCVAFHFAHPPDGSGLRWRVGQ